MICNENIETFITLFDYLKNRYKFNPKYITTDFSKAEILAYKSIFIENIIIPCFYHYCQNITRKLKNLKSKNKKLKNMTKDLFANLKILFFINRDSISIFYNEIKYKYKAKFPDFFKYFDKFYFKNKPFSELDWNYGSINRADSKIIFYSNNIWENCNRTLNSKFIGSCKTMYHFKLALLELISLYNNKGVYQEKN